MKTIHTLTVPDMMWVNAQVCGGQQPWDYATLEEAVFNQYAHGGNHDLAGQAARFLAGFGKLRPFKMGNEATAFVGLVAFLAMNGKGLHLEDADAATWVENLMAEQTQDGAKAKIEVILEEHGQHGHHGVPDVQGILRQALATYPKAVSELKAKGHVAAIA